MHHDLKPANILLDKNYAIKITDIGLASSGQRHTIQPAMGLSYQVRRAIAKEKFEDILVHVVLDWPVEKAVGFAKLALAYCELRKGQAEFRNYCVSRASWLTEFGRTQTMLSIGASVYNTQVKKEAQNFCFAKKSITRSA
ncbi:uncharacterized protein DS421_13g415160 [Arachis hypogaea]|nr:uncharacterized protein DS421_13g415160 [Arachis hypogaea]